MNAAVQWAFSAGGASLIAAAGLDMFRELVRPTGRGTVSVALARMLWPALRRSPLRHSAGAMLVVLTVLVWLGLLVAGCAVAIWPWMQSHFVVAASGAAAGGSFVDALYMSLVTISTLGYGDVVPTGDLARLVMPMQALFGLGLASATISWLLSIHPALAHRASLATRISLLGQAQGETNLPLEETHLAAPLRGRLTSHLITVHGDLVRFPISYYFYVDEERKSLPRNLGTLLDLASRCRQSDDPALRLQAAMLGEEISRFAATLDEHFLHGDGEPTATLRAWHDDHHGS
jgi:hypothetical protein